MAVNNSTSPTKLFGTLYLYFWRNTFLSRLTLVSMITILHIQLIHIYTINTSTSLFHTCYQMLILLLCPPIIKQKKINKDVTPHHHLFPDLLFSTLVLTWSSMYPITILFMSCRHKIITQWLVVYNLKHHRTMYYSTACIINLQARIIQFQQMCLMIKYQTSKSPI